MRGTHRCTDLHIIIHLVPHSHCASQAIVMTQRSFATSITSAILALLSNAPGLALALVASKVRTCPEEVEGHFLHEQNRRIVCINAQILGLVRGLVLLLEQRPGVAATILACQLCGQRLLSLIVILVGLHGRALARFASGLDNGGAFGIVATDIRGHFVGQFGQLLRGRTLQILGINFAVLEQLLE